MKVLLVGGLGYIGRNITYQLLKAGHSPIVLDNEHNSSWGDLDILIRKYPNQIHRIHCDITERKDIRRALLGIRIDALIHLANYKSVGESYINPDKYRTLNEGGTINLFKEALSKVDTVIFSSSASVYGEAIELPTTEGAKLNPESPYAKYKVRTEIAMKGLASRYPDKSFVSLRYYNPVGAGMENMLGDAGKSDFKNVVTYMCEAAKNKSVFEIHTNKDNDKPGTRDYIHVEDLATAHVAVLGMKAGYRVYNVGLGKGCHTGTLLGFFTAVNDVDIMSRYKVEETPNIKESVADASKLKRDTEWRPKYSVMQACRSAWHYYSQCN